MKLTHVPYKGGAPLATDLMGGQVPAGFLDLTSARAHLTSGRMKFLAISGARRYAMLPDVQARINNIGLQGVDTSPEQFAAAMRRDYAVWGRVVREAQIKLD